MKNQVFRRYVLLAVFVAIPLSLAAAGVRRGLLADPGGGGAAAAAAPVVPAGGAARTDADSTAYTYEEVEFMTGRSKAVVVGHVLSNECRLLSDKKGVETAYTVQVQQVLKGDLAPSGEIEVGTPGGMVLLKADGSEVSKKNKLKGLKEKDKTVIAARPGYGVVDAGRPLPGVASMKFAGHAEQMPMVDGQTYLLFLHEKAGGAYSLTPGRQAYAGLRGANSMADLSQSVLDNVRLAVERANGR